MQWKIAKPANELAHSQGAWKKHKYITRYGTPGHYVYRYRDDNTHGGVMIDHFKTDKRGRHESWDSADADAKAFLDEHGNKATPNQPYEVQRKYGRFGGSNNKSYSKIITEIQDKDMSPRAKATDTWLKNQEKIKKAKKAAKK